MFKHTQRIRRQKQTNCLSVFDHFVELALKGLIVVYKTMNCYENCYKIFNSFRNDVLRETFVANSRAE